MKIIKMKVMLIYIIFLILLNHIEVHATSYADEWLAKKQQQQEEYMKSLEKEGNLTEEVKNSITKKNTKNKNKTNSNTTSSYTGQNRGYVYGVDELHVIGLPTDERGYTRAGDYGRIEK